MNPLTELFSNAVAQRIGWALIHSVWQGTAVALVLALTLALLRRRSAQARWAVSCAALALTAALPAAPAMMVSAEAPRQLESAPPAGTADPTPPPELAHNPKPLEAAPRSVQHVATAEAEQTASISWAQHLHGAVQPALPWAAAARPPAQPEAANASQPAWGQEVRGLRMRVVAPQGAEFRRAAGLPLRVEIKNVSEEPVEHRRMSMVPEIQVRDSRGEAARLNAADRPPIYHGGGSLAPGRTLSWIVGLERATSRRGWKAGETLQLTVRVMVRGPGYDPRIDRPWLVMAAPPQTIRLVDDFPARLKADEAPKTWSPAATLIYHEQGIWWGSTWLRVDGRGRALLIRRRFGHLDKDIPPGVYRASLSKEQLAALAGLLRKHEFKRRREMPPKTDTGQTSLVLSVGGAAAWSQFQEPAEKREPALAALRADMRKILVAVAKAPKRSAVRAAAKQPVADPVPLTPATLGKWLAGKEVVEVCFAGPHMEPRKLRDSLKIKVAPNDRDFRLTAGEGGGANRSFVEICMKVTPENTRRLLSLQKELDPRGYRLDPEDTHVWSLVGGSAARAEARRVAPGILAAAANAIRAALPKARTNVERPRGGMYIAGIRYEVPGTNITGMVRITEITAMKRWELPVSSEQTIHLPRLGLMIKTYYRPGRSARRDPPAVRVAIRKAVRQAVAPLLELEGDTAQIREWPLPRPRPNPAPARRPAGIRGNPRIRREGNIITLAQDAIDADLAALRDVKGIVELRMGGADVGAAGPYLTDAGLANLSGWTDLRVLYLPGVSVHDRTRYPNVKRFTDAGLAHLRGLTKLEKLVLVDQEITDRGLANLSALTELRELWLDFIPLGDAGLKHLKELRRLQVLRLYGAGITDRGLRHLAGMKDMRDLQLGRARVTDKGLAAVIGRMHKLETLDLQGNPISDDGLSALANLTNLRWLALSNTPITDAGLKQVARLRELRYLFLNGTNITDAGLVELARLKRLKRLKVEKTSVTAEGIRKLKLSLPGLEAVSYLRKLKEYSFASRSSNRSRIWLPLSFLSGNPLRHRTSPSVTVCAIRSPSASSLFPLSRSVTFTKPEIATSALRRSEPATARTGLVVTVAVLLLPPATCS